MRQALCAEEPWVVDSIAGLVKLEEDWRELHQRCPRATAFQSPDWLLPWMSRFPPGEPLSLVLHRNGRLVALAPLEIERRGPTRVLRLMGGGISDYLDALIDPQEPELGRELLRMLGRLRERWDLASFEQLHPDSPLLHSPLPLGWSELRDSRETCPVLPLPPRGPSPQEMAPARWRRIRYLRRRLARDHGGEMVDWRQAGHETLLEALFSLHGVRWSERGESGVLSDDSVRAFHRDVAARFARAGTLLLYGLRADDQWISVVYGFADQVRHALYIAGFDPAWEKFSPGKLVVAHALEQAMEAGVREVDFLRGDEPYKYRWGAQDRPLIGRRCGMGEVW